jgi:hypothetical protein
VSYNGEKLGYYSFFDGFYYCLLSVSNPDPAKSFVSLKILIHNTGFQVRYTVRHFNWTKVQLIFLSSWEIYI